MTSDLSALFSFMSLQLSGPGSGGDGIHYRDPQNYYYEKRHALVRSGKRVDATVKEALAACGLDSTDTLPTRLNQRGYEKKRAAAAVVLASALIKTTRKEHLAGLYATLLHWNVEESVRQLRKLLTQADEMRPAANPQITLRNFMAAGSQATARIAAVIETYERSEQLLLRARDQLRLQAGTYRNGQIEITGKTLAAFRKYFGAPGSGLRAQDLQWRSKRSAMFAAPFFSGVVTRMEVVLQVLSRLCVNFLGEYPVRIWLGGRKFDTQTWVYVDSEINPIQIHVADRFFEGGTAGFDSRASMLIHELTHAWACTNDHAYGSSACAELACIDGGKALTNADSYRCFVEEAFG